MADLCKISRLPSDAKSAVGSKLGQLGKLHYEQTDFGGSKFGCYIMVAAILTALSGIVVCFFSLLIGIGMIVGGIAVHILNNVIAGSGKIYYFENGVVVHWSDARIYMWDELESHTVRRMLFKENKHNTPYSDNTFYIFMNFKDYECQFDFDRFGLTNKLLADPNYFYECRDFVVECILKAHLPKFIDRLKKGEVVQFGALSIQKDGKSVIFKSGGRSVSLSDVVEISFRPREENFYLEFKGSQAKLSVLWNDVKDHYILIHLINKLGHHLEDPQIY